MKKIYAGLILALVISCATKQEKILYLKEHRAFVELQDSSKWEGKQKKIWIQITDFVKDSTGNEASDYLCEKTVGLLISDTIVYPLVRIYPKNKIKKYRLGVIEGYDVRADYEFYFDPDTYVLEYASKVYSLKESDKVFKDVLK